MRKPEQRLYDTMRRNGPHNLGIERIENGVGNGTPDVHLIRDGVTRWVELKVVRRPKRLHTPLFKRGKIRKDQVAWHTVYANRGGTSFILARDEAHTLYLFKGREARHLHEFTFGFCLQAYSVSSWAEAFEEIFR